MAQPLISAPDVLRRTWEQGRSFLSNDLKDSVWFLVLALISFGLAILGFYAPSGLRLPLSIVDVVLVQIIGSSWVALRLSARVLSERQNKKLRVITPALFGSYLLISILNGLAIAGGALVFVLPGIWLSVAFAFAGYVFLDESRTGRQALARSAELVSGRWWGIVGRMLLTGAILLACAMIFGSVIEALVGAIAGYHPADIMTKTNGLSLSTARLPATQIAAAALRVIDAIPLMVILPFMSHMMVTLYSELKRTA